MVHKNKMAIKGKRKMNLLYLRTIYWFNLKSGGSVGHTAGVINELDSMVNLEVVSNDHLAEVKRKIKIIKPILIPFFPKFINELLYNLKLILTLKGVKRADAIYQRYSGYSFAAAWLSKKYNIPLILEFNSSKIWTLQNWSSGGNKIKKLLRKAYISLLLPIVKIVENYNTQNANLIVVVSSPLKDILLKRGIDERKILVNPNGVDTEKFNPKIKGNAVKEKYGLDNKFIYGFIGTFGPWHGVEELGKSIIRFYEKYPERIPTTRFLLIGDGMLKSNVENLINNSKFKNNVIFTGRIKQNEAPEYLSACDALISPHIPNPDGTPFFGSPTKLFEYMAMGKPIICSNMAQMAEILENRKDSLLVTPGDIEELSDGMELLFTDRELCNKLGENCREKVINQYRWHSHVQRIIDKFLELRE
jgi:glycosyltransferase involved in cell wall biosynthesis